MTSPAFIAAGVLLPPVVAVALAVTHPPRWDATDAAVGARAGFLSLLAVTVLPVVGPLLDVWYLRWLAFALGVCYAAGQFALPVLAAVTGYLTASGLRSPTDLLVFGTPAVAGGVWWTLLLLAGGGPPLPRPFTALDLATLPSFVAAAAYVAIRSAEN